MHHLDSRVEVVLLADGTLSIPSRQMEMTSYVKLGHMIREGYAIKVRKNLEDGSALDLTKETLVRIAMFPEERGAYAKKIRAVIAALDATQYLAGVKEVTEDALYLIIENGGLDNFLLRHVKDMVLLDE